MSCMVMRLEPLAALANAVEVRLNCDYNYWGFEAPDSLYRELSDCKTSCTYFAERIYQKLYAVNIFWLYQTAEDATYADPLRLAMREFRDSLYAFIVTNSPQYVDVQWGALPHTATNSLPG